jgi:hypothetical protein
VVGIWNPLIIARRPDGDIARTLYAFTGYHPYYIWGLLQRIRNDAPLILVTVHGIGVVLKADSVAILIDDFAGVIQIRILVDHDGGGLQDIDEEHADKETEQKRQELQVIKEFHIP